MTFTEFINRRIKTKVDFDGVYGPQCVDLFRQYHKDVVGGEHTGSVEGAAELYTRFSESGLPQYYHRKNITVAKPADVVVFGTTPGNPYGHVALFVAWVDKKKIIVFEQDGFRRDGAKFAVRDTDLALGILSPIRKVEI